MGICNSAESASEQPSREIVIGPPQNATLHIPRRRMDEDGQELQIVDENLSRRAVERALQYTGQHLHQRGRNITIVTVGGAVNLLYLRSREATHDVDFFGAHLGQADLECLDEAMQYAERMSSVRLGGAWLNNETQLHMGPDVHRRVTDLAFKQDEIIFQIPGLRLVAAPWSYAFVSKCNRLGTAHERMYDLSDAVIYLRKWNSDGNTRSAIGLRAVQEACSEYRRIMISMDIIRRVQQEYQSKYGSPGIVM